GTLAGTRAARPAQVADSNHAAQVCAMQTAAESLQRRRTQGRTRAHSVGRRHSPPGSGTRADLARGHCRRAGTMRNDDSHVVLRISCATLRRNRAPTGTGNWFDRIHSRSLPRQAKKAAGIAGFRAKGARMSSAAIDCHEKLLRELAEISDAGRRRELLKQHRAELSPELAIQLADGARERVRVNTREALALAEAAINVAEIVG